MALSTFGTNANNSILIARSYIPGLFGFAPADLATIQNAIKDDQINTNPIWPGAMNDGQLFIPNRGYLKILPGDWVLVDPTGWPILLSKNAVANGPYTHNP